MSGDGGATWRRIVEPSSTLRPFGFAFPQVVTPGVRAIYLGSAQGVLKLDLPIAEAAAVPAVTYWSMLLLALALTMVVAINLRERAPH